ncbi:MAG: ATP-binding protein, partial [Gemmatimonadota bacterium]
MLQRLRDAAEALATVREWVQQAQVEDLYLDFTRKDTPANAALEVNDKRGYAKALSGFANSDGGLLVWGVVAEKDKHDPQSADAAKSLEPISPLDVFLGDLNSILHYSTKPPVSGVENIAVPESSGNNEGYVVTYIPAGTNPPYRAENDNNNNYYKRAGSSFYPMEPYDIRDVVFRFRYPKIELELAYDVEKQETDEHIYVVRLDATNHGPTILKDYLLQVALPEDCLCLSPPENWTLDSVSYTAGINVVAISFYTAQATPGLFQVFPDQTRNLLG